MKPWFCIIAAALAFGASGASADEVYRCGPDGRLYQNKPCPQGKAVDVADPRSAEQRKSAQAAAKADARLGDELERDRRARESGAPPVKASGFDARPAPAPPAASAPAKAKKKPKETAKTASGDFVAVPPAPSKPKSPDAPKP